jgi:GDP-D-mannose 3', 5'-epimerase
MSEYKKTALVLGAGGFIGSHMVRRLRSEGYWVRGGDLRDVDFVRGVIEFKGEQGNFYNSVPYRYIRPFDEIYQFAADMGGAGFVFTVRMMQT